jgi:hypothetical protein
VTQQHPDVSWRAFGAAAAIFTATMTVTPVRATELIDSVFDTCTTINCSATNVAGWVGSAGGKVVPWTASFLATAGACLRLEMNYINGPADLEMVVVGPNGLTRWRNDNGGVAGCAKCSLVKIASAPVTGFYSAIVSTANGAAVDTDFHLSFGQYNQNNPNCLPATQPLAP